VIKTEDSEVVGCHPTRESALWQLAALNASENETKEIVVPELERRYTPVAVELRAEKRGKTIAGYAAVFNRESENLGGFVEVVDPGFFNKSRGDGWPGVVARYNHEILLGSTKAGTLRLQLDGTGLWYEVDPPQSRADILELVERGDVDKSSFAFRAFEDEWDTTDQGFPRRRLLSGQLIDVAPVDMPAYPDTSAGIRSLCRHFHLEETEVRSLIQRDELRKLFRRTPDGAPARKPVFGAAARMALLARQHDPYV